MNKWEKEYLIEVISTSKTQKEVLRKMGLRSSGSNSKTLKKYIKIYDIDISHFEKFYTRISSISKESKISLSEILINGSEYNRTHLKKRLYDEGLKERICELCGQDEYWNGMKISLILDHINGIYNDNRIESLRILCPNCNAGLDTHCGKNKLKKVHLCDCGKKINRGSKKCLSCSGKDRRRVERPNLDFLKEEIKKMGYSAVGRKYNVSDNTIRKWIYYYKK